MYATTFLDLPPLHSAQGSVTLPGSKSISNRLLLLAALCQGQTVIHDLLDSDDTRVMLAALRALGCTLLQDGSSVTVTGLGGQLPVTQARLFLGNAGTAMRPLCAALAVLGGDFELGGVARMHERPIADLVDALRQLGCRITYLGNEGFPPLHIGQPTLQLAAPIRVRGDVSSQFLTALLLALPLVAQQDIVIEVVGELISRPYIEITLNLLARFGVLVRREGWQRFTIAAGSRLRSPGTIHVEADASSASYFIALGAIATRPEAENGLKIWGVGADSIQGDIRFLEAAEAMGAHVRSGPNWLEVRRGSWPLKALDLDCNHIPDAAMTLAVMALYAQGTTTLRNIASWRVKETDRIAAMATELRKLGASVVEGADFIPVTPPAHADWRAAAKTFPDYFETLFSVTQAQPQSVPVLCIDGPTASGKGTLAEAVARELGNHVLDSGSLYRITGLAATRAGLALDASQEPAIAALARGLDIAFRDQRVWLGGEDVSDAIRSEQAGMNASRVSALPQVRQALVALQHGFRRLPGLVADGRDMGSVIFPDATLKVYLTASAQQRAERRYKQLISKGISATLRSLCADLELRDARDTNRAVAPLRPAEDARLLDNSELSIEESSAQVLRWWQAQRPFSD